MATLVFSNLSPFLRGHDADTENHIPLSGWKLRKNSILHPGGALHETPRFPGGSYHPENVEITYPDRLLKKLKIHSGGKSLRHNGL